MNRPKKRIPFMPRFGTGAGRERLNEQFRVEVEQVKLQWRCPDCSFRLPDGRCSQGWPNDFLLRDPIEVLDETGMPLFCKAFEPIGH